MEGATKQPWDLILRLGTLILPMAAIFFGVHQFTAEQRIGFERDLWEQKLETYVQIATVVGRIAANTENEAEFKRWAQEYRAHYFGTAPLVQDNEVEVQMRRFSEELRDFQNGSVGGSFRLELRALRLVQTLRNCSREDLERITKGDHALRESD